MRFLIDADLPRSLTDLVRRHGHEAEDVRDIGLGAAKDDEIAKHAQVHGLCLVTGDFDFADIRNYPPEQYAGIVVLELPRAATASSILHLVEALMTQTDLISRLPGRLAVVEPGRIRFRPA